MKYPAKASPRFFFLRNNDEQHLHPLQRILCYGESAKESLMNQPPKFSDFINWHGYSEKCPAFVCLPCPQDYRKASTVRPRSCILLC